MALRPMLVELGMSSIPSILPVPRVQDAFDKNGTPLDAAYEGRVARFLDELEWYARALKRERELDRKPDRSECEATQLVTSNT